ncbi:hypothetical protein C5E43_01335 [Nocardia cyriacigeorgica]|nr:hypothetical protein C5B73_17840 [Nocardia cyriacigeorgica]PPJ16719.1 hypothetical protein C5E43_01335 [Nocardia cyriacigeorgica]
MDAIARSTMVGIRTRLIRRSVLSHRRVVVIWCEPQAFRATPTSAAGRTKAIFPGVGRVAFIARSPLATTTGSGELGRTCPLRIGRVRPSSSCVRLDRTTIGRANRCRLPAFGPRAGGFGDLDA